MVPSPSLRAAAIAVLAVIAAAALAASSKPSAKSDPGPAAARPAPSDRPDAAISGCGAIGPEDPGEPRCEAAWAQNRRRFFGVAGRSSEPTPAGEAR
ncbi:MAG: putative entry exclusion protein TrbK-alt [Caulobacteraceae bacterium]|nr:putative entry exclusion protein TrbK-alt [Caulobacteraceae bacterium]